jgi:hypothetical protein
MPLSAYLRWAIISTGEYRAETQTQLKWDRVDFLNKEYSLKMSHRRSILRLIRQKLLELQDNTRVAISAGPLFRQE